MPTRSSASVTRCRRSAGRMPAIGQRQLDVFEHREIANQIEALEDEPDLAIADARALRGRELGDRTVVQLVRARRGRVEQAENRQQRRFAAAGWSADRDVFAPGDLEADLRERVRLHFLRGEDLREILKLDDRRQSARCSYAVRSLLKADAIERVPRRHVGQDDLVADVQSREDFHRVHRDAADLHLHATGAAVAVNLEQSERRSVPDRTPDAPRRRRPPSARARPCRRR